MNSCHVEPSHVAREPLTLVAMATELGPKAVARAVRGSDRYTHTPIAGQVWFHLSCLRHHHQRVGLFQAGFVVWCYPTPPPELDPHELPPYAGRCCACGTSFADMANM